jgi:hypothetical protein
MVAADRYERSEKEAETANMGIIYSNAFVTIAADSAQNCEGGLDLDIKSAQTYTWGLPFSTRYRKIHCIPPDAEFSVERSPLTFRGWILQEMFLSARVLHFNKGMMFWHCGHMLLPESRDISSRQQYASCWIMAAAKHHSGP